MAQYIYKVSYFYAMTNVNPEHFFDIFVSCPIFIFGI